MLDPAWGQAVHPSKRPIIRSNLNGTLAPEAVGVPKTVVLKPCALCGVSAHRKAGCIKTGVPNVCDTNRSRERCDHADLAALPSACERFKAVSIQDPPRTPISQLPSREAH